MEKLLKVEYGTIFTQDGIGIDNMAVLIDKQGGLMKYGDSEKFMDKYYADTIIKYKKVGLEDVCDDLIYIKFDRYDGVLNIYEICTFVNYMLQVSANGDRIMKILYMEEKDLKLEIARLNELGF